MESFGVKLTSGKIMWVKADEAECRDVAVVFYRIDEGQRTMIAGFSLTHINHFGVPSAFGPADPVPALPPS